MAQPYVHSLLLLERRQKLIVTYSPAYTDTLTELESLSNIIQQAISSIKDTVTSKHLEFPSAYSPVCSKSEAPRMLPDVELAVSQIVSAANQLVFTARSPYQSIIAVAWQVRRVFPPSVLLLVSISVSVFSFS